MRRQTAFDDLTITNLTGHPTIALPTGMEKMGESERPSVSTITGKLFGETEILALAHLWEKTAGVDRRRPPNY